MSNRGCLFFCLLLLAGKVSAQTSTIEIRVYDHAGLPASILREFASRTQGILTDAGLSIRLKVCPEGGSPGCETEIGQPKFLVIRVVAEIAKKMREADGIALGQSFADDEGGTYASVFLRQVQEEATSANVPWITVLAYATAHEVGHLLLGNRAHTPRGLMKAHWDRMEYEAMNQGCMHFSPQQRRQLAKRYGAG